MGKVNLISDHSYSWWVKPRTTYKDGVNYWSTIGIDGNAYLHKYDGNTVDTVQVFSITDGVDEHNAPSFLLRDNDIFVVSHPRNGQNFRARTLSYDFQTLGSIIDVNAGANFVDANYSQLFVNSNGRIFIFCRENTQYWAVTWSDDDGLTWTEHVILTVRNNESEKLYMNGIQDGDRVYFGGYSHPDSGNNNLFWNIEFDLVTGYAYTDSQQIMSANDPETPLSIYGLWGVRSTDNYTSLFNFSLGKMRFLDIAFNSDKTKIYALCIDIENDDSNGEYYLVEWDRNGSSNITQTYIIDTGIDTYDTYFGGAYFVKDLQHKWNGEIYLARESSGTWYVEKWEFDGSSISKTEDIDSLAAGVDGLSLTRPEPPLGSTEGGLKAIYQKGDYDESFVTWDNELIGITSENVEPEPEPNNSDKLFNRLNSVPSTLKNKTFALVRTVNGFSLYVGDGNNNPVPLDIPVGDIEQGKKLTGTSIALHPLGNTYNYDSPSSANTYTVSDLGVNRFARCFINAASEPTVTGGTKINTGDAFISNTDMELCVDSPNGSIIEYYFLER